MKKIALLISIFLVGSCQEQDCPDIVIIDNKALQKSNIKIAAEKEDIQSVGRLCECYNDWDSVYLKKILLLDDSKIFNAIKIDKELNLFIEVYMKSINAYTAQKTDTSYAIYPKDVEQLRMEICAINQKDTILDDKYSEQDVVSYLRIIKYQGNDSIVHEGINLRQYFNEINSMY